MTAISVSNAMGTFKIPPHSHQPAPCGARAGESPETLMGTSGFSNDGYWRRKASAGSSLVALQAGYRAPSVPIAIVRSTVLRTSPIFV